MVQPNSLDLIVIGSIAGILLSTVVSLLICMCCHKDKVSSDHISDMYDEARIYAAHQYHIPSIPRVVVPRERWRTRAEARLDLETIVVTLPPTYAHVIEHSQDFPHPDPLELEMPPPTYQEVIRILGMGQSIQHI